MRTDAIRLRGIGPFHEEVTLNIVELPGPLVAITGDNGAGKTVLLESIPGCYYRKTPTRGSLVRLATTRDSLVETVTVIDGETYTFSQTVDAVSGGSEAVVVGPNGPLWDSTQVSEYDAWAKKNLVPPSVFFAGPFSSQGKKSFIDMLDGVRKETLIRILDHQRLELKSAACGVRARECSTALAVLVGRLDDIRHRPAGNCEAHLNSAKDALAGAKVNADTIATKLAVAAKATAAAVAEDYAVTLLEEQHASTEAELKKGIEAGEALLVTGKLRLANNAKLVEDRDAITAALAQLPAAEAKLVEAGEAHHQAVLLEQKEVASDAQTEHYAAQLKRLMDKNVALVDGLQLAVDGALSSDEVALLEEQDANLAGAVFLASERIEEMQELGASYALVVQDSLGVQITSMADRLRQVTAEATVEGCHQVAEGGLIENREASNRLHQAPEAIAANRDALKRLGIDRRRYEERRKEVRKRLEYVGAARANAEKLASGRAALLEEGASLCRAEKIADGAHKASLAARAAAGAAKAALAEAQVRRDELKKATKHSHRLEAASARVEEITLSLVEQGDALNKLRSQLGELEPVRARKGPSVAQMELVQEDLLAAQPLAASVVQDHTIAVDRLNTELAGIHVAVAKTAELLAEKAQTEVDLGDWRRLQDSLGKNGLQAMEIDAAGPRLSALLNRLLHECHGPRFTASVQTTRGDSTGKKQVECFALMIEDAEEARIDEARWFSGGEKVIIAEAVHLALTVMGCKSYGLDEPILVRDETSAALSPENCIVYMRMLRLAAVMVGAPKVLFVSHQEAMNDAADSRVVVKKGRLEIE